MEVLTPGSKTVQSYLHNRLLTYIYRGFRNNYKPGAVTRLRADEVSLQFPSLSEGFVKKHLRHCADLQVIFKVLGFSTIYEIVLNKIYMLFL